MPKVRRKVKVAPAMARVQSTLASQRGKLVGSAVGRLLRRFADAKSADTFASWRMLPETQLFIDALRECATNPRVTHQESDSYEVEFGVTSGFQIAAQILDDPSLVFEDLFGATPSPVDEVSSEYSEPPIGSVDDL